MYGKGYKNLYWRNIFIIKIEKEIKIWLETIMLYIF